MNRLTIFSFIVLLVWTFGLWFGPIWCFLGYAAHGFGAVRLLARQLRLSSNWLYLVHHSSLLNVVSLEGEKL